MDKNQFREKISDFIALVDEGLLHGFRVEYATDFEAKIFAEDDNGLVWEIPICVGREDRIAIDLDDAGSLLPTGRGFYMFLWVRANHLLYKATKAAEIATQLKKVEVRNEYP